tara:strand:+ start:676 stop:1200 length:525 start_codon:yes stop_codon:yes gene_type:complete
MKKLKIYYMNREIFRNIFIYSTILTLQIFIFNHINLFEIITPYIYILIFIIYKTSYDKTLLLLLGFLTGIIIDLSIQTYGCHTFATITICYLRTKIEKTSFGVNANLPSAMVKGTKFSSRAFFFLSLIFIHSITYYSLIFFNINAIVEIFSYTIINSIITFMIVWVISKLISNK